jgi:hypothetical protein
MDQYGSPNMKASPPQGARFGAGKHPHEVGSTETLPKLTAMRNAGSAAK